MSKVWENAKGEFLQIHDVSKWGIERFKYSFTKDLNEATVCYILPFHVRREQLNLKPQEVLVTRKVEFKK